MRAAEQGFLLLTCDFGDPERKILTAPQLRTLASRMEMADRRLEDRELEAADLISLGYSSQMAQRIVSLLSEGARLDHYLRRGKQCFCHAISRISPGYPLRLRKRLGLDAPGCLWAKGDVSLLDAPKISLVGSRELRWENRNFAAEAGAQAAKQGYVLVSGNARGADRTAQEACLKNGGSVICVIADSLGEKPIEGNVLYLSEGGFDHAFSAQRALSRNRIIHALSEKTLVAQSDFYTGGTWDGSTKNLKNGWSSLFCFDDGLPAAGALEQMGATLIGYSQLEDLQALTSEHMNFLSKDE